MKPTEIAFIGAIGLLSIAVAKGQLSLSSIGSSISGAVGRAIPWAGGKVDYNAGDPRPYGQATSTWRNGITYTGLHTDWLQKWGEDFHFDERPAGAGQNNSKRAGSGP